MTGKEPVYAKSYLGDRYYKVTDYKVVDEESGKIVANHKEPVDKEDVPEEWLEKIKEMREQE